MGLLRSAILAVVVAYLAAAAYMYVKQRSLQYFPANRGYTPALVGLADVIAEKLQTPDGETIILWFAAAAPGKPTVLFFQGNAAEIGDRAERIRFYRAQGFGICFVSYRGYGGSTGSPTEQGLLIDAEAAYQWLIARNVPPASIALVGESLGTGVAVRIAARHEVGAIALEAPYTATVDVASAIYWWLPVSLLMKDQFKSRDYIADVKAPVLVIHGDADTIIPVAQGRALYEAIRAPKELVIIPGGTHDVIGEAATWAREADFFSRTIGAK